MLGIKAVSIAAEIREIRSLLTALLGDSNCGRAKVVTDNSV
jgi:hypothetical protein